MLRDGENLKDNQRNEITIRNIKLSECTNRNRCIHSRIDVRAKSVKGKLFRIKMSHTNFEKGSVVFKSVVVKQLMSEYCKRILHLILNYLQTQNGDAYFGYTDMDKF